MNWKIAAVAAGVTGLLAMGDGRWIVRQPWAMAYLGASSCRQTSA